jgi:sugar transferase (PEP-CTERM/EpsH1 system associated)
MVHTVRVAHIVYALDTGGLENGLVNVINRLPKNSYQHLIVCLTVSRARFSKRINADNVEIIELKKSEGNSLSLFGKVRRALKSFQPDVVHSRNLAALEAQVGSLFIPGIKRIHGEHGRDIYDLDGSNWKYNLLRRISRLWIHHYIAVSSELAQWLHQSIGVPSTKISRLSNGVDCQKFSPANAKGQSCEVVVGAVGRLAAVKDHKTLIEAMAYARDSLGLDIANCRLIIIGDGPLRAQLSALSSTLELDQCVEFLGDRADVADLLKCMDVFVLPSLAEGVSNTLLEAMASGLPVIATSVGGTPEIVRENQSGYLVNVGDIEMLAERIVSLINNRDLRQSMGRQARTSVKKSFDWDVTVTRYHDIYQQAANRKILLSNAAIGGDR